MRFSISTLALITGAAASGRYVFTAYTDLECHTPVETGQTLAPGDCWENINIDPNGAVQIFYGINLEVLGWSNADCTGDVIFSGATDDTVVVGCFPLNGIKPLSFSNPV